MRRVELPLALPLVMAGVRTAARRRGRDRDARRVHRLRRARHAITSGCGVKTTTSSVFGGALLVALLAIVVELVARRRAAPARLARVCAGRRGAAAARGVMTTVETP